MSTDLPAAVRPASRRFGRGMWGAVCCLMAWVSAQGQSVFIIEAEDFNYQSGQTRSQASTMPYYGGAYTGLQATFNVDFNRPSDGSSPEYRNDSRIPMNGNGDVDRGTWSVNTNYKLGWIGEGMWFNYTRTFPTNFYKVYASLSHGETTPSVLRGSMQLVTSGATTTSQTLQSLGSFDAPGTGGWGANALVPLKDGAGQSVVLQLGGTQTIRFTAASGDVDYYRFAVAGPPQIAQQPQDVSVVENRPASFTVLVANDDPVSYQWQSNQVNIAGASSSNYTFTPKYTDNGARFRCVLSNPLGTLNSAEASLTVTRDTIRPLVVQAVNLSATTVRLTFDEGVGVPGAPASASFSINNGVNVLSAGSGSINTEIVLTTSALNFGTAYTVTLRNVPDLAAIPNVILPGTTIAFVASEYSPADVGNPAQTGSVVRLAGGGFDVTGGGSDIGGNRDELQFAWQQRSGDFDVQTRVQGVTVTDPFVHAGLMLRETLADNARFAGVFGSSPQLGSFFESRSSPGTGSTTVAPPDGFPANYPQNWLRLRRTGTQVIGFASLDGQLWTQLGSVTLGSLPSTVYFGLAVSSGNSNVLASAAFRDVGPTATTTTGTQVWRAELLGPSNRRTGMIFSEILYHPKPRADGRNLEFVELYNARSIIEDLSGWRISGEIDYRFPDGFKLQAGDFVVVAAQPADLQAVYGSTNVLGPYTNALSNSGGPLRLRNAADALRVEVNYSDEPPWAASPDGAGHSLVLSHPSFGEDDPRAWSASERSGGSPGTVDTLVPDPRQAVVLNEWLAHTDLPQLDFIELHNRGNSTVDLSGCVLTDDPTTNRFVIPNGTSIGAHTSLAFLETQLGFRLDAAGESIYFISGDGSRVFDAVRFGAQENAVASGRSPDGSPIIRRLQIPTPDSANSARRVEQVVINEIMYHPITEDGDDEYVELHNRGGTTVDLSGWRLAGEIDYRIPDGTSLAAGGFLVVSRNVQHLLTRYPGQLNANNTLGNFDGALADGGETLRLQMPDTVVNTNELGQVSTNLIHINVGEIRYFDGGRWGQYSDGGGSSLELMDPRADPAFPSNWRDSDETAKAQWTIVSVTGRLDNGNTGFSANRLHVGMLGPGECMVDDVEVIPSGGVNQVGNGAFESGISGWSPNGNHSTSTVDIGAGYQGSRGLHVRGQGDGDTGVNTIRSALTSALANNSTATIRAKVRWLGGWPEVLFRLRGNYLELPARMDLPSNLGTPGAVNSRRLSNTGPAIHDVRHSPALPRANESVLVTCRISDPDNVALVTLRYRQDPSTTLSNLTMSDNGTGGDLVAGDGLHSATITGRSSGVLVAFRIEARDDAGSPVTTTFPESAPSQECLIRWGDPIPIGNFAHYHLWSTAATENARNNTTALNNTWRDATLVYGNGRVIYNAGFRDKGSPWHGGSGDFTVTVGPDDRLLGATDRVFASTGNGGSESTGIRSQTAAWLAQQLGIPYLHAHYMFLYRNGGLFREIAEDLEQPNHNYAQDWFPTTDEGDLYKVAMWFEFQDDNTSFNAVGATIERFLTLNNAYKTARYRWHFQRRSNDGQASNFTNLFDLVAAINNTAADYTTRLNNLADVEQWVRSYNYSFLMGNWDAWSYSVGQNMYAYKPAGRRWVLIPWDIDFVFGLGDGPSTGLWSGQDPVINRLYDTPEFRRMVWRSALDAVNGPFLPGQYQPQLDLRRTVLLKNRVTSLQEPSSIGTYIDQRRAYILGQIAANDAAAFLITSNNGNNYNSTTPTTVLTGRAPFAVATIEVSGIPYPVTWTDPQTFRITVPLTQATNLFVLIGRDLRGQVVAGATDTIQVTYSGAIQLPQDFVALNEVHFNPLEPSASFVEFFNASTTTPFDLSGWRLDGAGYTFPDGALLPANGYLLLVKNRAAFAAAYGATIPVFDEFPGQLDNGGEHLALVKPGTTPDQDLIISDVAYDDQIPWPVTTDGQGPSLQLIDPFQDPYRRANWAATATNDLNRVTPGRLNVVRQTLPAFPTLWINEVLPNNQSGLTDAAGDRDPWIEFFNTGANAVDLSGLYLTDDFANLTKWPFPAGTTLGPQQFLLIWADGEPGEVDPGRPHASFRLNPSNGSVALSRLQGSPAAPAILDYLDYVLLSADRSVGAIPDGEPRRRRLLHFPTPAAPNNPAAPPIDVRINEFMARNTSTIIDPADQNFDDWFELYNAGAQPVDLTAYTLTDNVTNFDRSVIPPGYIIPAGGFLLVWADNQTGQNSPTNSGLHVNFALAAEGEQLALFAPDGSLVDSITFGPQTTDVSLGLIPDGGSPPLLVLDQATPGEANFQMGGNLPPVITAPSTTNVVETVPLTFTVQATDPDAGQTITFSLWTDAPIGAGIDSSSGQFAWTPAENQGPGVFAFTLRATDNGIPQRTGTKSITVTVTESNRPPTLNLIANQQVDEGSLLAFDVSATDPDSPANGLSYTLEPGAPTGVALDPGTGAFTWTPGEEHGPADHPVTVRVTDNGVPPLVHSRTFTITVNEVNNPPILPPIQAQTVPELATFRLTVLATDPDSPPSQITYALELAPSTARIDPVSGEITWIPTEADGPTNAIFIVRATESSAPNLSSSRTFSVNVTEQNLPPTLNPIADVTVLAGTAIAFQALGNDPDLPPQTLSYSLAPGSPSEATIDITSGQFLWPTPFDAPASTNSIQVRVTDDGPGNLTASQTFSVVVQPRFLVVLNEIMYRPVAANAHYIELANLSTSATQDLSGLRIDGNNLTYTLPQGILLPPLTQICVAANLTAFNSTYGSGLRVVGPWTGTIGTTDTLRLIRPGSGGEPDEVLDTVTFSSGAPWPLQANGGGASLQLIDPLRDNDRPGNWAATSAVTGPQTLVPLTQSWRYYQNGALPATWSTNTFNDDSWPSGPALLYVESTDIGLPRQTPLTLGQWTYYFRTEFNLGALPVGGTLELRHAIDDGAVFWLNGRALTNYNMPPGVAAFDTPASTAIGDASLIGPVNLPDDLLQVGENLLAVEVHQISDTGSSDIVMGCSLVSVGGQVPAFTPSAPNSVGATLPEFPTLRINEVLPLNTTGLTDRVGEREPWIEIVNTGDAPVPLDGLSLTDDPLNLSKWTFPAGWSVVPGGYLVIFADNEPGESLGAEFHTNFRLPSTAGSPWWIALTRFQAPTVAAIDWLAGTVGAPNASTGRLPDGDPSTALTLAVPSPGAPNGAAAPPQFTSISLNALGQPALSWSTTAGRSYRVEFKNNLSDLIWQTLQTVPATGSSAQVTDSTLGGRKERYYQVVLLP